VGRRANSVLMTMALGATPCMAWAQQPPAPVVHEHDGFYLRAHLGVDYARVRGGGAGNDLLFQNGGPSFGAALGGSVVRNLALFGEFLATNASDPYFSQNGSSLGNVNGSVSLSGFGGCAVYFFESLNVYVSGSIAVMRFELITGTEPMMVPYRSQRGLGFHGLFGKEWWVSQDWGLGIAAEVVAASMKDGSDASVTWTATSVGLLFSATYN